MMGAHGQAAVAERLILRAQGEFIEMPGLNLTVQQAARLWATDSMTSERILERLVAAGFLGRGQHGSYLRHPKARL